jgi:hypothetical protein
LNRIAFEIVVVQTAGALEAAPTTANPMLRLICFYRAEILA